MSDLNDFLKLVAEAKAKDPKHQVIKQIKESVKEDVNDFFKQLSDSSPKEIIIEEEKIDQLIDKVEAVEKIEEEIIKEEIPQITPEEERTAEILKLLAKKDNPETHTFQQPQPDTVAQDLKAVTNKLKYLEQWVGKIAATGPGGGEVNLRWLDDVDRSTIQDGYALVYNAAKDKFEFVNLRAESAIEDTGEPMGHVNKLESAIAFDNSTRTFSISPVGASFSIYTRAIKRTYAETQSVTIPNTTGLYYIYFDTSGILQYRTDFFDWPNDCMTAYVYWNSTTNSAPFVADERHGIVLDWQTHEYLHRTRGASYANGFTASNYIINGNGTLNTHCQLDLTGGTFFDEDLQVDIVNSNTPSPNTWEQDLSGPAKIPMFYRSNNSWTIDSPTEFPLKQGTTLPVYNNENGGNWTITDLQSNKFGITFILATNNINYPIIGIIGQKTYDTIALAQARSYNDVNLTGFPVVELRPLYKLIYQVKDTFTNTPKAILVEVEDIRKDSAIQVI